MRSQPNSPSRRKSTSKRMQFAMVPALAITDSRLKSIDIRVLAALAINADKDGLVVRSQIRLANELGIARSTLQRSLDCLKIAGWLTVEHQSRPDGGTCSCRYFIQRDHDPESSSNAADFEAGHAACGVQPLPPSHGMQKNRHNKTKPKKPKDGNKRNTYAKPLRFISQTILEGTEEEKQAERRVYVDMVSEKLRRIGLDLDTIPNSQAGSVLQSWYDQEFHPELDVVPKVAELLLQMTAPPRSLAYFTSAIRNSHLTRAKFEADALPDDIQSMRAAIEIRTAELLCELALKNF